MCYFLLLWQEVSDLKRTLLSRAFLKTERGSFTPSPSASSRAERIFLRSSERTLILRIGICIEVSLNIWESLCYFWMGDSYCDNIARSSINCRGFVHVNFASDCNRARLTNFLIDTTWSGNHFKEAKNLNITGVAQGIIERFFRLMTPYRSVENY